MFQRRTTSKDKRGILTKLHIFDVLHEIQTRDSRIHPEVFTKTFKAGVTETNESGIQIIRE